MRFFTTVTAAIVAAAVAAPAFASPIMNPLHSAVGPHGGVKPKPTFYPNMHHAREDIEARNELELEARGWISDKITAWLDKNIHLHRRLFAPPNYKPRPNDGLFHILPYLPNRPSVAVRDEFRTAVMPQGWQDASYRSPPFVNPNIFKKPGGGLYHTLPYLPNKAVARDTTAAPVPPKDKPVHWRPVWDVVRPGQYNEENPYMSPPFVNPDTLPKRAATKEFHTQVMPQKDRPMYQSPPFVPPGAVTRPPYGAGVRPARPLGPGVRPLTN